MMHSPLFYLSILCIPLSITLLTLLSLAYVLPFELISFFLIALVMLIFKILLSFLCMQFGLTSIILEEGNTCFSWVHTCFLLPGMCVSFSSFCYLYRELSCLTGFRAHSSLPWLIGTSIEHGIGRNLLSYS